MNEDADRHNHCRGERRLVDLRRRLTSLKARRSDKCACVYFVCVRACVYVRVVEGDSGNEDEPEGKKKEERRA